MVFDEITEKVMQMALMNLFQDVVVDASHKDQDQQEPIYQLCVCS